MSRTWLIAAAAVVVPVLAVGAQQQSQQPAPPPAQERNANPGQDQGVLRVCGDPDNLPFSNMKGEGFENKIAALIAREMGDTVKYTWWPQRRGFVRNTLRARECDILIGAPNGFDPVIETKPYYRSTYYFVTRTDRNLRIASLDDPALKKLKIGVNVIGEDYTNTPPAHALGARGITARGYDTFYNAEHRPEDIINAVAKGDIDVAVVWGPLAGYFAKRAAAPLTLVPLPDSVDRTGFPFAFDIAMGMRRSDKAFKAQIDEILERTRPEIDRILEEYNVPRIAQP
jgi:mxaJ protein